MREDVRRGADALTDEQHAPAPAGGDSPAAGGERPGPLAEVGTLDAAAPHDRVGNGEEAGIPATVGGGAGGGPDDGSGSGDGDSEEPGGPEARKRSATRTATEWLALIVGALVIALVIKTFLFQAFYIPSESMVPTLKVRDRVLVNKLSYKLHDVNRGDIVVFKAPPGTETEEIRDLVKRVVGLPGETVEGRNGRVYIDGRLLEEPYLPPGVRSKDFGPEKVPAGRYFVLGDNRQFSKDSTYFHSIRRSEIIGRAFVRIWPLGRLGFL